MPVSFFTKESLFPSCQRSWNIFSIISLFHSWVCLLYERQGIEWKEGMNFGSQVCFASCMTVTELFNLSTPTWSYLQMRIIISTLQGCCQNLKCLAIISKIQAPMTWTCFLAEGFLLVQLLEKQGNFLLFWIFAILPDRIKQSWDGGGETRNPPSLYSRPSNFRTGKRLSLTLFS